MEGFRCDGEDSPGNRVNPRHEIQAATLWGSTVSAIQRGQLGLGVGGHRPWALARWSHAGDREVVFARILAEAYDRISRTLRVHCRCDPPGRQGGRTGGSGKGGGETWEWDVVKCLVGCCII